MENIRKSHILLVMAVLISVMGTFGQNRGTVPWNPDIVGNNNYTCTNCLVHAIQFDIDRCCACQYIDFNISAYTPLHLEILNVKGESIALVHPDKYSTGNVYLEYQNRTLRAFPTNLCDFNQTLRVLDLAGNLLNTWVNMSCLQRLEKINLSRNLFNYLSNTTFIGLSSLRSVDLSYNKIKTVDLNIVSHESIHLFHIDLSHNFIQALDYSNFVLNDSFFCNIDYSFNEIQDISNEYGTVILDKTHNFGGDIYLRNMKTDINFYSDELLSHVFILNDNNHALSRFKGTFDLSYTPMKCDCNVGRFLKYYPDDFYRIYESKHNPYICGSPPEVRNLPVADIRENQHVFDQLTCDIWDHCPRKCKCIEQPSRERLFINCSYQDLHEFPVEMPPSLFKLDIDLSNNYIGNLNQVPYLNRSFRIDLANNYIKHIDAGFLGEVTSIDQINLENNQINYISNEIRPFHPDVFIFRQTDVKCDCKSKWIKDWRDLKEANSSLEFGCRSNDGKKFIIENFEFSVLKCNIETDNSDLVFILVGVLGSLLGLTAPVLVFRTELTILSRTIRRKKKMNWNYDIFISFDEDNVEVFIFMQRFLMPMLRRRGFKIFSSGDMLAGQARELMLDEKMCRVEPRDVIIVLSNNFDQSKSDSDRCWMNTEFEKCWPNFLNLRIRKLITLNYDNLATSDLSDRRMKAVKRVCPSILVPDRHNTLSGRLMTVLGRPNRTIFLAE